MLFKQKYTKTIKDFNFTKGDLVLICNSQVKYALNKKMKPWYLGLPIVTAQNKGGMYIICELDGSVLHRPIAAFHFLTYLARKLIHLPDGFINIDPTCLCQMEEMDLPKDRDYAEIGEDIINEKNDQVADKGLPDTDEEDFP